VAQVAMGPVDRVMLVEMVRRDIVLELAVVVRVN
jgi:hypothetical protein